MFGKAGIEKRVPTRENQPGFEKRPTPIQIASASVNTTVLSITFDQPVVLRGTPAYTTDVAGAVAVSATSPSPTQVDITFDQDISLAAVINIPYAEENVRSKRGGYVADSTFTI